MFFTLQAEVLNVAIRVFYLRGQEDVQAVRVFCRGTVLSSRAKAPTEEVVSPVGNHLRVVRT